MADKLTRKTPRRTVGKKEAVRHLLHTAIRMVLKKEDVFGIHLLAQSADKLLIDLSKNFGKPLALDWGTEPLRPEYKSQFFEVHRETFNFFKHADRDYDAELPVSDIVTLNMITISVCVLNYHAVFGEWTDHMKLFHMLSRLILPDAFVINARRSEFDEQARAFEKATPSDFCTDALSGHYDTAFPKFASERAEDLVDNGSFYTTSFPALAKRKPGDDV